MSKEKQKETPLRVLTNSGRLTALSPTVWLRKPRGQSCDLCSYEAASLATKPPGYFKWDCMRRSDCDSVLSGVRG